jgi:hypothetical protein
LPRPGRALWVELWVELWTELWAEIATSDFIIDNPGHDGAQIRRSRLRHIKAARKTKKPTG